MSTVTPLRSLPPSPPSQHALPFSPRRYFTPFCFIAKVFINFCCLILLLFYLYIPLLEYFNGGESDG